MWKSFIALLVLASPVLAQERPTAYQALRVVGTQLDRSLVDHVISVRGMEGNPQPAKWTILLDDPKARGGVREVEVANDKIVSERTPMREAVAGSLGATIDTTKLNLDSSGAHTVAQQTAAGSHVTFTSADYLLHVDERGNPVWQVTLHRENGDSAGLISIGANHGTITRTEGLFSGGEHAVASNEQREAASNEEAITEDEDDDGDVNPVKRRIKQAFHEMRDDVKRSFYKARESFVDFVREH